MPDHTRGCRCSQRRTLPSKRRSLSALGWAKTLSCQTVCPAAAECSLHHVSWHLDSTQTALYEKCLCCAGVIRQKDDTSPTTHDECLAESEMILYDCVENLLEKTGIQASEVGLSFCNCCVCLGQRLHAEAHSNMTASSGLADCQHVPCCCIQPGLHGTLAATLVLALQLSSNPAARTPSRPPQPQLLQQPPPHQAEMCRAGG